MQKLVLGIFGERSSAEDAIDSLKNAGFNPKDISIIMKDSEIAHEMAASTGSSIADGAVSGATTGGILGGVAGLLVGLGAITIPGIGALLVGGPIATALGLSGAAGSTLTGVLTGAVAGGLVGGLIGLGLPEEDARIYEDRIKEGAILLAIPSNEETVSEVTELLDDLGAEQINVVSARAEKVSERLDVESFAPAYHSEIKKKRK